MNQAITLKTYLDESGNSGKNLRDENQPFFTLGAVIIYDKKLDELKKFISKIPPALKDDQGEVKGNNIACYQPKLGLKILTEIIPQLCKMAFFNVVEKKFMIAGQIVENFFDPAYNDKTDDSWTHRSENKIIVANFFYENLTEKSINLVHNAFLSNDLEKMFAGYNQIVEEIKGVENELDIFNLLLGAKKHLASLTADLFNSNAKNGIKKGVPKNTINTPNVAAYFAQISEIENFLSCIEEKSSLIFDSSEQYNKIFDALLKIMNEPSKKILPISDEQFIKFGFEYLNSFSSESSNSNPGLQLADILSSNVNYVFNKIIDKDIKELNEVEVELILFIFFACRELHIGNLIVSNITWEKIYKVVRMKAKSTPNNH